MKPKIPKRACSPEIDALVRAPDFDGLLRLAARAKPFKDGDGIQGRLVVEDRPHATMGPRRTVHFDPTAAGRRSEAYRTVKAELRDDWVTDLTNSEALVDYISAALRCRLP